MAVDLCRNQHRVTMLLHVTLDGELWSEAAAYEYEHANFAMLRRSVECEIESLFTKLRGRTVGEYRLRMWMYADLHDQRVDIPQLCSQYDWRGSDGGIGLGRIWEEARAYARKAFAEFENALPCFTLPPCPCGGTLSLTAVADKQLAVVCDRCATRQDVRIRSELGVVVGNPDGVERVYFDTEKAHG